MDPSWVEPGVKAATDITKAPEAVLKRLSTVQAAPVSWLWRGWLPEGALSVLDGDPGLGKSTLTLDLAARVSRGWRMPPEGGEDPDRDPAHVLLLGAEDSLKHTVRPRLDAAGADPARVTSLDGFRVSEKEIRDPVLPWDLRLLEAWVKESDVRLIIVDPLMAFLGEDIDAHKDQHVRRSLRPLRDFAEELGITILLLRHLNKLNGGAALYRGGGSIAFTGAARSSMIVGRDPQKPSRHVLAMNKANLTKEPQSLAYVIEPVGDVSKVAWEGECDLAPHEILWHGSVTQTARGPGRPPTRRNDAETFLAHALAEGPVLVSELEQAAGEAGLTWGTVQKARATLGIKTRKEGACWVWEFAED